MVTQAVLNSKPNETFFKINKPSGIGLLVQADASPYRSIQHQTQGPKKKDKSAVQADILKSISIPNYVDYEKISRRLNNHTKLVKWPKKVNREIAAGLQIFSLEP